MRREQAPQFTVDTYKPHDTNFVIDSWLKGYRESPLTLKWTDDEYEAHQRPTIDRLLPRSRVFIARPNDWAEGIMGYLVTEQTADAFVVHWSHVKPAYRTLGIPQALLSAMEPHGRLLFSHLRPPFTD